MSVGLSTTFKFDYDVCINVRNVRDGKDIEDPVYSHRIVLITASPFFKDLLLAAPIAPITSIDVDLRLVPNALEALKATLAVLYTGEVKLTDGVQPSQVLCVARICQLSTVESKVLASMDANPLMMLLQQPLFGTLPVQNYFQSMLAALYLHQHQGTIDLLTGAPLLTPPSSAEDSISRRSADSSPRATPPVSEKVLPLDDKDACLSRQPQRLTDNGQRPFRKVLIHSAKPDPQGYGWCRNKKYIEKVENGFMCTVCRKIYGRYNSVSYHVTIYHRNPPIRCDEPGCQFSTREARYIHFHKYYRHHIPLPESIDLGSRKCPHCRHVSKSPAMLEKHMTRHQSLERKDSLCFLEEQESKPDLNNTVPVIQMTPSVLESPIKSEISV